MALRCAWIWPAWHAADVPYGHGADQQCKPRRHLVVPELAALGCGRLALALQGLIDLIKKYDEDSRMKEGLKHALENVGFPGILEFCDDVAAGAIEDFAKLDPAVALPRAKAEPDRYYLTWTYALMTRLAQFAQSIPPKERARGPFGRYAKLLKAHRNDLVDTVLATQGARCGVLITQDEGLLEPINFLQARGFIPLQAREFSDVETNWNPPPMVPQP